MESYLYTEYNKYKVASYNIGCIMDIKGCFKGKGLPFIFFLHEKDLIDNINVESCLDFISKFGFKTTLEKENSFHKVIFNPEDYKTTGHFMAAFTAVRYLLKSKPLFGYNIDVIFPKALEIKALYPQLDEIACFQLGHYLFWGANNAYIYDIDYSHSCMKAVSTLLTNEECIAKANTNSANMQFHKNKVKYSWIEIYQKLSNNFEETLKELL